MTNIDRELVNLEEIVPDEAVLADIRNTRLTTPMTRALIAPDVIACAFLGGALPERWQHQSTSSAPSLQALIFQFRGVRGIGGTGRSNLGDEFPGLGDGTGGATIGTVKLVDGTAVYVQGATGDVVRPATCSETTVTVSKPGWLTDPNPRTNVKVQGTAIADGSEVSTTSISPSSGFEANCFGSGNNTAAANAANR